MVSIYITILTVALAGFPVAASGSFTKWFKRWDYLMRSTANSNCSKGHLPYHESDHILNIAYNILSGGTGLEDIDLRRNDEAYLNALGAQIIPDPTTAGDYLRRFDQKDIILLMDIVNDIRKHIWLKQSPQFKKEAHCCPK
jgi:hypothetical protein